MVTAVYPGTFDPITNGHADIAARASRLFDKTFIAVADSPGKSTLFSLDERVSMAKQVLSKLDNVHVISFSGLVTNLAHEQGANVIVRGIRAVSDFDYEFQMAGMNRQLISDIETVFLTPAESLSYITSTLVREIASFNGDVGKFVDDTVLAALTKKFS